MTKSLDFYFDFTSPYGFLASQTIEDLAKTINQEINWRPFLIGAVYKEFGGAPLNNPMKFDYFKADLDRSAKLLGLNGFTWPDNFPGSPIPASRAFYWIKAQDTEKAAIFAKEIYRAYWLDGCDTSDPSHVVKVAGALGFSEEDVMAGAQDEDVKNRLRLETEAAIKLGVFGSPFIIIDGEKFWGNDRFDQIIKLYG
ncbi:putative 2-hydroxychromene-2-carboxylate isomerase (HCCA isomerase) [Candidatus Terasakiella magnetica]|uniref:2-hydroxychromene-2-carboxylate isomerase n=1 Tax=Candidatus Terasakiella magnetica TaxID=1867952 RepID=A0A1C3RH03_9PROT|nr:2-hydroxychromene-2-carboxylate isomerase [Candidatus Terasakiella magnetica]SCA56528.1 putative 2-hydroxychromene-2-carboxylate isomerase (HCCA isomerase) [Candidatus Terasakiella magnetica]